MSEWSSSTYNSLRPNPVASSRFAPTAQVALKSAAVTFHLPLALAENAKFTAKTRRTLRLSLIYFSWTLLFANSRQDIIKICDFRSSGVDVCGYYILFTAEKWSTQRFFYILHYYTRCFASGFEKGARTTDLPR